MLFNSIDFILFLIIVILLFAILKKLRVLVLLASSLFFYGYWKVEFLSLIIFSGLVDFIISLKISKSQNFVQRKLLLIISLFFNFGFLFYFKYFNFLIDVLTNSKIIQNKPYFEIILPVGISFYTFQTVSYTIDVFNNRIKAEKSFFKFLLYVSFFPQLVAGPIERAGNLIGQFSKFKRFSGSRILIGFKEILFGFFLKLVIADRLAGFVNPIFNDFSNFSVLEIGFSTFFFGFQIYCDFHGYSLIAIGVARLFGIHLMKNFNHPYLSTSLSQFWRNWHISLSSWFKDYLYVPLGGSKISSLFTYRNLLITFLISGLWHGANYNFIIWGGIHGCFLIFERIIKKVGIKSNFIVTQLIVFFSWFFFRLNSISDIEKINFQTSFYNLSMFIVKVRGSMFELGLALFFISLLIVIEYFKIDRLFLFNKSNLISILGIVLTLFFILAFGVFLEQSNFIYFQF